jgi:trehalose/maltose hydrolase-like predicted phosphorylase
VAGCRPPEASNGTAPAAPRGPAPIRVSSDSWVLSTDSWNGEYRGAYLGNGYLGQRLMQTGTGISATGPQPAYMAGLYASEALVTLPPLLPLEIRSNGRVFGAEPAHVKQYHQELRLREGVLVTRATWDKGAGEVGIEIEAALLRQYPGAALLRAAVDNRSRSPVMVGVPDSAVPPSGPVGGEFPPGTFYYRTGPADSLDCTVALGSLDRSDLVPSDPFDLPEDGFRTRCVLPAQQKAQFALASYFPEHPKAAARSYARLDLPIALTSSRIEECLEGHRRAWERLWEADIEIEGDPEAQQVVRACLFYLLSSMRDGSDAGVPPMGLSSSAFLGHVFWDMDSWMFPALLPQHPQLGRAMLEYRYRTLAGARANAKAEGLPGASYAWESAQTGKETLLAAEFRHGRHVSGDVALALKQYYTATGDRAWLQSRAWPILQATADNWAARAKPGPNGTFVIKGVTTPDELAGQVDHSAWTHHVARVNLEFAADTARLLGRPAKPKWEQVAKGLTFLRDPDTRLILPYAGFTEKKKAKQADVLLLAHPGEADLNDAELGRMYDYYAPRVIQNGPAMTDAIHAVIAARLGRDEEALHRFRESYRPFVRPPFHLFSEKRTRDNLCFLTGAAGVVEAVLYGFAGLYPESSKEQPDRPRLEPHLPTSWTALRVHRLHWRGKTWTLELKPGSPPVWRERK